MIASNLHQQADTLARYLISKPIHDQKIYELYDTVISQNKSNDENKLIDFAFRNPGLIPYLDAGLVFIRPESEFRKRIFVMFAILESTPEYSDLFLPKNEHALGYLKIIFVGCRAILRALIGIILLKVKHL